MERVYEVYKHLKDTCQLDDLPLMPTTDTLTMTTERSSKTFSKTDNYKMTTNSKIQERKNSTQHSKRKEFTEIRKDLLQNVTTKTPSKMKAELFLVRQKNITDGDSLSTTPTTTTVIANSFTMDRNVKLEDRSTTTTESVVKTSLKEIPENTRKIVVFFVDNQGQAKARLEYH